MTNIIAPKAPKVQTTTVTTKPAPLEVNDAAKDTGSNATASLLRRFTFSPPSGVETGGINIPKG